MPPVIMINIWLKVNLSYLIKINSITKDIPSNRPKAPLMINNLIAISKILVIKFFPQEK
jgi:hypothetical protein